MGKDDKTNVMRLLSAAGIEYSEHRYDPNTTDGELVAKALGKTPEETFKTLVTEAASGKNYVFVIPVHKELNLKACGRAVKEKSIVMLPQKKLFPLTGYVHGGCSPIGMKRTLHTVFDESALEHETITLSAGKLGRQITVSPVQLITYIGADTFPLTREKSHA